MFTSFSAPLPWSRVFTRTVHKIGDDHCFGLAAQLAFYFLMALFPALLFLVALIGHAGLDTTLALLLNVFGAVAPGELMSLLRAQLDQLADGGHASLLTLGMLGALWSSSAGMVAVIDALNHAYDVREWRPWWKRRLVAITLTAAMALFIVLSLMLVLVGPALAFRLSGWLRIEPIAALLWSLLRWPVMIGCVVLAVDLVYHFAPNRKTRWQWLTPGSVLATALWLVGSFGFKLYVANLGDYTAAYGAIGGVIVTMLWFYVSSLAILIGAELNGVIEVAWRSDHLAQRADNVRWVW